MKLNFWPFKDKRDQPERLLNAEMQARLDCLLEDAKVVMETLKYRVDQKATVQVQVQPAVNRRKKK